MKKRILFLFLFCAAACAAVWALVRFTDLRGHRFIGSTTDLSNGVPHTAAANAWMQAVEKVKADRGEAAGGPAETPPELKHYSERYWFLATQVAEIEKYRIHTCQDFLDLAGMIQRGELVSVPFVTDSYVLYGIGQRADDAEFSRFEEEKEEDTTNQTYSEAEQQRLARDYEALHALAKNFGGRSYDLNNPADREALKINMLSSLRPEALKILEEVAAAYHRQFDRPLPVSSLVRPEQYQRALRRVNRNATRIETPPHSTGLAFDIDYRYMSGPEQSFVMTELARIKKEGRIEVIRESNANYHVFAFLHGKRPPDDLITASLEEAGKPVEQDAHHAAPKVAKAKQKAKSRTSKARRPVRKRRR